MPTSKPPSPAEGSQWHDIRDLSRFVAEAALVSGGIVLAALVLL